MKILVNILCGLIPSKKHRKKLRDKLIKARKRKASLLAAGCSIEGDIAITRERVRFDISDDAKVSHHIQEIFVDEIYRIKSQDESVVIDIGMNRAVASLYFATMSNIQKIYAFEPFEPTFALAMKNLDLNPTLREKIQPYNYGLGKETKTIDIPYVLNQSDMMTTTHALSAKQNFPTETVTIKDAALTLGAIFQENINHRIIVKCDCEGAEFEIFERLNETGLLKKTDTLLIEFHFDDPTGLIDILMDNGFIVQTQYQSKDPIIGYLYAEKDERENLN